MVTMTRRIGVLDGDGIGPEIVPCATAVAAAAAAAEGIEFEWVPLPLGRSAIDDFGTPVPEHTLAALDGLDCWILGPHDSAGYPARFAEQLTPGAVIRKRYGLYANIRPCRAWPGVPATAPGIDVVVARENSEGLYADRNMAVGSGEFMPTPDIALAVGVVTRAASERIAHQACRLAETRSGRMTIVHKANVLRMTTGLFRDACRAVAAGYPGVTVDDQHVDAMAALLVRRPADFDVLVTENLFGDILSDLAGELAGSIGLAGSINSSDTKVMAQAAHGAAPDIAGAQRANPVAIIASTAMALRWWGTRVTDAALVGCADRIERALGTALADGITTPDLGGSATTTEVGDAVTQRVAGHGGG
ncbi:isocitrate/isopropylmalate family dehydrogenase [Gordonia sp. NB41Y]|uniref:isocitrate/isopropylmalate dehydrogenase family protein n=1 Tax=Gordonia sp. NB41Y TaxID=875808 RepID=UPI0009EA15A3|nr:isocitrate/isopropylmalate family dehydrogenase [Gordonia sp. NB41Y]WLP90527.1 isocitrate/isopropylmalate family dehydrogenase [Gordonia sp. NB41Y]